MTFTYAHNNYFLAALLSFSLAAISCKQKGRTEKNDSHSITEKTGSKKISREDPPSTPPQRAPIINITDTIAVKQLILYTKDSAATSGRISQKLAQIYGFSIPDILKKNKLKITGAPVAWYRSQKAPFFFEAGLPIDKKPAKLPKGFFVKNIGGDSAVVAHFFGPYSITPIAYEALNDFLKSRHRQRSSPPYEIYVGDPFDNDGKKKDPYKVQTDIVFPYK